MKLAVMQPYFMPYIGYFQLIHAVEKFVIYDDVNYINRGWINRNNILVNGVKKLFSIPLLEASQNKLINEIDIVSENQWRRKLLKTVEQSYNRAPHFTRIFELFKSLIDADIQKISELNVLAIKMVCDYLGIRTEIVPNSTTYNNRHLKGQFRILDICLKENASIYINPIGGIELYQSELFQQNSIQLFFIKSSAGAYRQGVDPFIPGLSILDMLMNIEPSEIKNQLNHYQLIQI